MQNIKKIYLYAVTLISLVMLVIATVMLINLGLKALIFTKADNTYYYPVEINCDLTSQNSSPNPSKINSNDSSLATLSPLPPECSDPNYKQKQEKEEKDRRTGQNQNDAAQSLALILVAAPLFYYHWRLARKESQ